MARRRHKHASRFCAWAEKVAERNGWTSPTLIRGEQGSMLIFLDEVQRPRSVNVPAHFIVDALVRSLYRGF